MVLSVGWSGAFSGYNGFTIMYFMRICQCSACYIQVNVIVLYSVVHNEFVCGDRVSDVETEYCYL